MPRNIDKVCSGCHRLLSATAFGTHKKCSGNGKVYDFSRNICKPCRSKESMAWNKAHPDNVAKTQARRRHKQGLGMDDLTSEAWQKTLKSFNGMCAYCGNSWQHRDHLIPVAMGGELTKLNTVPACASCNSKKNDKNPFNFIGAPEAFTILLETHL